MASLRAGTPVPKWLFGYKAKEVLGRSITILLIPEDHADEEPRILESIRRGEKIDHYETVRRRKDGKLLDISLTVSPIRDPSGVVIGASKIARDITGRREIEAALRAKEAELRMVADTTPLVLVRCTRDLKYKFINLAGSGPGTSPDEMIGRTILDVMGKRGFAIVQPYIRTVLRGEPIEFEAEVPYPAAGPRWMHVSYEPERDEQDKVVGWLASIVDITEIKAAEEADASTRSGFRGSCEPAGACLDQGPRWAVRICKPCRPRGVSYA